MFDVNANLHGEEVVVDKEVLFKEAQNVQNVVEEVIKDITTAGIKETVSTTAPITTAVTIDELTLAQALEAQKTLKPKIKGIVVRDHEEPSDSTTKIPIPLKVQDKGKGIMVEEHLKMKKKDHISFDKKFMAAKRAEEKINRPPTRAQQRSIIYMDKEVVGSSKKSEAEIAQESSSKRAGDELEQESAKKQKVENDNDSAELKRCLEIVPDNGDDVTIDATPLSSKSPTIVDYKIYKEGRKVICSWSLLNTMCEHNVEDNIWRNQQGLVKVLNWKLFDSCRVHYVSIQNTVYYLLVEEIYPLINHTLTQMWNDVRLQVDYKVEMIYALYRLVRR
nr:hypothetical protein [Tanacetum cinerariifolium]